MKRRLLPSFRITIRKRGLYFLTRLLKHLFRLFVIIPLLFIILFIHTFIYLLPGKNSIFVGVNGIHSSSYFLAIVMIFISIILHEMGHLSACHYLGCGYRGLQFYFPNIFRSWGVSITNVWRLNPKKRVIIDLGGIWFQLIFCAFLFIIYLISGSKLLILVIFLVDIQLIWGLIPYKKNDGFWFIIDLSEISEKKFSTKQTSNNFLSEQKLTLLKERLNSLSYRSRRKMQFYIVVFCIFLLAISTMLFTVAVKLSHSLIKEWAIRFLNILSSKELPIIINSLFLIFFWIIVLFALMLCFWRIVKFVSTFFPTEHIPD